MGPGAGTSSRALAGSSYSWNVRAAVNPNPVSRDTSREESASIEHVAAGPAGSVARAKRTRSVAAPSPRAPSRVATA